MEINLDGDIQCMFSLTTGCFFSGKYVFRFYIVHANEYMFILNISTTLRFRTASMTAISTLNWKKQYSAIPNTSVISPSHPSLRPHNSSHSNANFWPRLSILQTPVFFSIPGVTQ